MKAGIEAMYLQPKERQGRPANDQKLGEEPGTDPPSGLQKGPSPRTLELISGPQDGENRIPAV